MYYCMYFHPNVYGLKLVKHSVFLFTIECLHLSNAIFIETILLLSYISTQLRPLEIYDGYTFTGETLKISSP